MRDPHNYFGILQAIAQGRTRLNEIAQATGLGRQPVSRYLAVLQELQVIERRVPVTETQPEKSRRGVYRLRDPFLRFWFRFVFPQASLLERGQTAPILAQIEAELPGFIGPLFEELCQEWVLEQGGAAPWDFLPTRVGAWWGQDAEIDVMAVSDRGVLMGECKWTARPVGTNVLDDLKRKAYPLVQAGGWPTVVYLLCARTGFTPALEAQAREEGVLLVGPEQLLASPEA
jgi:AAA+ ATPase superfamily predicted ATPase